MSNETLSKSIETRIHRISLFMNQRFNMKVQFRALRTFFIEFCANSSIHGVRYFTEKKIHWSERFWWAIAFGLSIFLCGYSIQHIWTKWYERPIVMSLNEKEVPISEIPFPVVTICPQTKTTKDKLDIISAYNALARGAKENFTDIESSRLQTLFHLCSFYTTKALQFGEKFVNESIYDIIQDIAPSLSGTLDECLWQYNGLPCPEYFAPILTREGLCFTFNDLNSRDVYTEAMAPEMMIVKSKRNVSHWNYDYGYDETASDDVYPLRIFNAKHGGALVTYQQLYDKDLESLCQESSEGYKVILSVPGDSIEMTRHHLRVPILEKVEILITAKLTSTSEELRGYAPNQRGCFYSTERRLRFYKIYTQNNCEAECLANFTATQCECVRFSMPRPRGAPICGRESIQCYRHAEKSLFGEDIIDGLRDANAKSFRLDCNCLPACTTITYGAEIDRTKFNFLGILNSQKISLDEYLGVKPSLLMVSFEEHFVISYKRNALYTITDFLAVCGGLLGLFLGVSALSIIEFFYYSTLRLYWKLRQAKTKRIVPIKRGMRANKIPVNRIHPCMQRKWPM